MDEKSPGSPGFFFGLASLGQRRSIEYLPGPVTHSSRPPMIEGFL
ncbi:hypothetical protein ACFWZU_12390 [Frateuria sp. GZRR33]